MPFSPRCAESMSYTYKRSNNVKKALIGQALRGVVLVISSYGSGQAHLYLEEQATGERVDAGQITVRDTDNNQLRVADNGYFIAWTENYAIYVGQLQICTISNQKQQSIFFKNSDLPEGVKRFLGE